MKKDIKSNKPKLIIGFEPEESGYTKKSGTLQTYFETGMECTGLVFYEDGIYGPPNPSFDPSKPEDRFNFKNFASYDALTFIKEGHIIRFIDNQIIPFNQETVAMIKDSRFAAADSYRLSFYPQGFSIAELEQLFVPENVKVFLYTKESL